MAELRPYPIGALITRMFRELERERAIFDLSVDDCFFGDAARDLSVKVHGHRASTPLGPAAGPHSQMAQNIVSSFLVGCRVMELKTVQINDKLVIPRPCIDMATVGYNVEWSQELRLAESLEEYVKGAMLIEILRASGRLPIPPGGGDVVYDMSVGYDLAGIRSPEVQAFIHGMKDATRVVDKLRAEIPDEFRAYRDLDFQTKLSDTLTLSTFHGCPPDEIERIIEFLLRENELHCVVKLNPMLLGPARARELLHDVMGYQGIRIPDTAFERDTSWAQMEGFVERLGESAAALGRGFGVKFSNTLIVENHRDFFPRSEKEMYLSGKPLYVLAMNLVQAFRKRFGHRYPISFSAGIDRGNFADAAALGLVPITVCSDLLKPGGYPRAARYFEDLGKAMDAAKARSLGDWVIRAYGLGAEALSRLDVDEAKKRACLEALDAGADLEGVAGPDLYPRWIAEATLQNTEYHVPRATADTRYAYPRNQKPPRKVGSRLVLFDCLTCNKCVPVCPNNANFVFVLPRLEQPIVKLSREGDAWVATEHGKLVIDKPQQYANFADFCNDCGNCDVFCPEDGGPYLVKPRFFGTLADFHAFDKLDGFAIEAHADSTHGARIVGRIDGKVFGLEGPDAALRFSGPGFDVTLSIDDPAKTVKGDAPADGGAIDLTYLYILRWIRGAVFDGERVNYLNVLPSPSRETVIGLP